MIELKRRRNRKKKVSWEKYFKQEQNVNKNIWLSVLIKFPYLREILDWN